MITNHGKTVAVITSPEKYIALQENQKPQFETLADATLASITTVVILIENFNPWDEI
ncbi:MAG: hypothetical protein R2865_12920 [Deinococcales bacterium]